MYRGSDKLSLGVVEQGFRTFLSKCGCLPPKYLHRPSAMSCLVGPSGVELKHFPFGGTTYDLDPTSSFLTVDCVLYILVFVVGIFICLLYPRRYGALRSIEIMCLPGNFLRNAGLSRRVNRCMNISSFAVRASQIHSALSSGLILTESCPNLPSAIGNPFFTSTSGPVS